MWRQNDLEIEQKLSKKRMMQGGRRMTFVEQDKKSLINMLVTLLNNKLNLTHSKLNLINKY
jgi:hypothetical protein